MGDKFTLEAWVKEAERHGLSRYQIYGGSNSSKWWQRKQWHCLRDLEYLQKQNWNPDAEIQYESYAKAINIEARTMIDMARKQFIPAVIKYTKTLADTVLAVKEAGVDASVQAETLEEITVLLKR